MGNQFSKKHNHHNSIKKCDILDFIVPFYLLSLNMESLKRLQIEKDYCQELIDLTATIIQNKFTSLERKHILNRIQGEVYLQEKDEWDEDEDEDEKREKREKRETGEKQNKSEKDSKIIAKFYIQIAHVFASLVMTAHPVFSYKDHQGQEIYVSIQEKDQIPPEVDVQTVDWGFCEKTLSSPAWNMKMEELEPLYYDHYDPITQTFTSMTPNTEKEYNHDLMTFYEALTGSSSLPFHIHHFGDISLLSAFSLLNQEQIKARFELDESKESEEENLFVAYGHHLCKIINTQTHVKAKLLDIMNQIFEKGHAKHVSDYGFLRIHPSLHKDSLSLVVQELRNQVFECNAHFHQGLQIYEAIVEKKIMDTTRNQITKLQGFLSI